MTALNRRTYVALIHYPVLDKQGAVVTTAVTNLDIHDIARASCTFGLAGYFVVTPITLQRDLVSRIVGHWTDGAGREHNDKRTQALSLVAIVDSLAGAVDAITRQDGVPPYVVATGARARPGIATMGYNDLVRDRDHHPERPLLVLFGTGWGLADAVFQNIDGVLAPIEGRDVGAEYNHLSVRSAVAIVLDRLFGRRDS